MGGATMSRGRGPVGWGVVGFGWVARDFMAPGILAAGGRLAAVCDPSPASRAAGAALGARGYAALGDLLADPEVEAVYVATPNHLHRGAVEEAAAAGRAVLCEKPMAAALPDAEAMGEAVRRSGILYGTAFDQRHHPGHRAVRDAVRAGRIGRISAVRIVYACWVDAGWSGCAGQADSGQENWRIAPAKAGGGALMDLAPHGLDLVDFLLDEPLDAVAAMTQARVQDYAVDDGALLIGRTGSGVLASLHVAYNCPEGLPRRRLEVLGSTGQIVAVNTMGQDPGGEVTLVDGATGEARALPVPEPGLSPFAAQARAFGEALRSGDPGPFSLDRDLHTMRLLARAYRAAERAGEGA